MRLPIAIGLIFCTLVIRTSAQWRFSGDSTPTWEHVIERYAEFDRTRSGTTLVEIGQDDDGSPIHLFVLSDGSGSTPDSIRASGKNILWITNGIHPGEPDGIDASLLLAQALLDSDQYMGLLANNALCIVPVYNVSGARQRNSTSRVNQDGPAEYGFRGNARNLDLNRDFIKADSRNTRSLIKALNEWDPDVYFETHVSNGADHQYVMELLVTHPDKLDSNLRRFMHHRLMPRQQEWMEQRGHFMCPYFETLHHIPEQGLTGFVDGPRYSTGYNALRQRIGVLSESHMLKPYADRVNATFELMLATLAAMNEHAQELQVARGRAKASACEQMMYASDWSIDTTAVAALPWKGYMADTTTSAVSGLPRWRYHRDRPTTVQVPWMNTATGPDRKTRGLLDPEGLARGDRSAEPRWRALVSDRQEHALRGGGTAPGGLRYGEEPARRPLPPPRYPHHDRGRYRGGKGRGCPGAHGQPDRWAGDGDLGAAVRRQLLRLGFLRCHPATEGMVQRLRVRGTGGGSVEEGPGIAGRIAG
ncbi:MAG TPA: M14 family zinc carboxypeptidase [Flavobacteriales bacterium]|nr:M14 family zinc carboxypeptidase [Flavobacteriales bacterium]